MAQTSRIANVRRAPVACFDSLDHINQWVPSANLSPGQIDDFAVTVKFLHNYVGSRGTFNSYRREVERLLQWTWVIADKTLMEIKREDIEAFVRFCQNPPKAWIGLKKPPRFLDSEGQRFQNTEWRPFVVTVSKSDFRKGEVPHRANYVLSNGAIKESLAILSSFYNYLLQEDYTFVNPVTLLRQKSKAGYPLEASAHHI